jgi:ABC-type glutathione transport system ATPase component
MALLEARGVDVVYEPNRGTRIWSVRDVDLTLQEGEFVGLVGESGCGKTTLGYALTRMLRPPARLDGGSVTFDGVDIATLEGEVLRRQRRGGFALVCRAA